jgi:short-subunit dehydrogenase
MPYRATPADGLAWITGASSGIGRAVALELARRGYQVAATARRVDELDVLAKADAKIHAFPGDVTDRNQMAALVPEIEARFGPIALAFLNAGLYLPAERRSFSPEIIAQTFDVNIGGTVNCLAPVLDAMRKRRKGHIAITSSLAGYSGIPGSLAYGASKAALISMAEALRLTVDDHGVNVQIVNPGFVATAMTAHNNFFEMPFLMTADAAAKRICDGFEQSGFEITFPRRLAWTFKAARFLPYALFLPLMKRATRRALR